MPLMITTFNLHVKMLRDAENAKFGLKAQGKASSSKENEVMVFRNIWLIHQFRVVETCAYHSFVEHTC